MGDVDMDIKMIKAVCEEHEMLTKTNEALGRVIDLCEDDNILFTPLVKPSDMPISPEEKCKFDIKLYNFCLSKTCINNIIEKNLIRINEIENMFEEK